MYRNWKRITAFTAAGIATWIIGIGLAIYLSSISDSGCRDWSSDFSRGARLLRECSDPECRSSVLSETAKAAAAIKEYRAAERFATEALQLAPLFQRQWHYGNTVHDGHMVLGRVALARGDRDLACRELLAAGATKGSPQLNSFGPNMALARDLLKAGERDTVFKYFDLCGKFWVFGDQRLKRWRLLARLHLPPDFGANLLY